MNPYRPTRFLVALGVSALGLVLTACGDDDVEVARGDSTVDTVAPSPAAATTATGSVASTSSVAATSPPTMALDLGGTTACASNQQTLEVAIEAFRAMNGAFPATEAELVEAGILREEIPSHDFDPESGAVFVAPGVDCDRPPATTPPPGATVVGADVVTAEAIYADFEASGVVEAVGGPECARELAEIAAAGTAFIEREGRDPESLDELAGDLDVEIELWVFDPDDETLLAAPGSGCVDLDEATAPGPHDECAIDRKTMEVAVEAYVAQFGGDVLPDEAELVDAGFLRQESDRVDVVDGKVIAVPGAGCD